MTEHENELKKALAENGDFDTEKAKQTAAEAVSRFNFGLRWTERCGIIVLLICIAVFECAAIMFAMAFTTKAMIGYAVVMLLSYVIGVVSALFSRITSMLLRVLREIKQLQLEYLGYPADRNVSPSDRTLPFTVRSRALTRWETTGWTVALLIVAVTVAVATHRLSARIWPSDMVRFEGVPVTLDAPRGAGAPVYYHLYLRMDKGSCKVSRVTPEHKQSELFWMGKGFVSRGRLSAGDSLRLDPQGNTGEYWMHFE
jgi:hypothetical protein